MFPYLGEHPRRWNPVLDTYRPDWTVPIDKGITPASFPSGYSEVPLKFTFLAEPAADLQLRAGFFGVGQESDSSLLPVISWSLLGPEPIAA